MKTSIVSDKGFLGVFRHWVAEYNRLLEIEGTIEHEIYEDFYVDLEEAIGQIKFWFNALTESKEVARAEFNLEEIPKEFVVRIEKLSRNLTHTSVLVA